MKNTRTKTWGFICSAVFLSQTGLVSPVFAQLKVLGANGNVGIGTFMPKDNLQVGSRLTLHGSGVSSLGFNTYWNTPTGTIQRLSSDGCSTISFGSDGGTTFYNAAPGGAAGDNLSMNPRLVIASNGDVAINSYWVANTAKLNVEGNIRCTGIYTLSDRKLKSDIQPLANPLAIVSKLKGVSYKLAGFDNQEENNRTRFGFIAQDVQAVLPEVVHVNAADQYAVDYLSVIPYLVECIKQQQQIEELKARTPTAAGSLGTVFKKPAALRKREGRPSRNRPTPFDATTLIDVAVPPQVSQANLFIYDMQGAQKQRYPIQARGSSTMSIDANALKPGIYFYSLVCDEVEVDTKKMIITDSQ